MKKILLIALLALSFNAQARDVVFIDKFAPFVCTDADELIHLWTRFKDSPAVARDQTLHSIVFVYVLAGGCVFIPKGHGAKLDEDGSNMIQALMGEGELSLSVVWPYGYNDPYYTLTGFIK